MHALAGILNAEAGALLLQLRRGANVRRGEKGLSGVVCAGRNDGDNGGDDDHCKNARGLACTIAC